MRREFRLRFPVTEIRTWAEEYLKNEKNSEAAEADRDILENVVGGIQRARSCTLDHLRKLCRWKYGCWQKHYEKNCEDDVRKITRRAFELADDVIQMRTLTRLRGVAWRTASAILHWFTYDETPGVGLPIIDFRTLWSTCQLPENGQPGNFHWDSPDLWREYVQFCRDTSKAEGVTMRELDRALWMFSKVKSKGWPTVCVPCDP